jgi:hypothetical protein
VKRYRLAIDAGPELRGQLKAAAKRRDVTLCEVVRRSVAVYEHLAAAVNDGSKIQLKHPDGSTETIQFL